MNKKNNNILIIIIVIVLIIIVIFFAVNKKPSSVPNPNPVQTQPVQSEAVKYVDNQYGFSISLPDSWKGYSVVSENWTGTNVDDPKAPSIAGPKFLIRHPLWTAASPRQDIPIMIFTPSQWNLVLQEKLSLGAAPIGPSELGRNANYIFALPSRYNFAFLPGFEEVQQIIDNKSLKAF